MVSNNMYYETSIDMTPKHPVLDTHNGETNGKMHLYSDKQICWHVDLDTIVHFCYTKWASVGERNDLHVTSC